MKLKCKIDGEWITRLCDGGVSWLLQNEGDVGCRNGGIGVETLWEWNGLPWEHSAGNQWEGGQAETRSLTVNGVRAVGWAGRG